MVSEHMFSSTLGNSHNLLGRQEHIVSPNPYKNILHRLRQFHTPSTSPCPDNTAILQNVFFSKLLGRTWLAWLLQSDRCRFIYPYSSPGRPTKDKSSPLFPLISRQTELKGNDRCLSFNSSGLASKNKLLSVFGFRIAHWVRQIWSVTRDFSKMGSPNSSLQGRASSIPFASLAVWSETTQHQGPFKRDSWHSVGHLRTTNVVHRENNRGDDIALPCTQMHGGDSRNPASCVSGRHIVDLKNQLERPSHRVRPGDGVDE